MDDLLRPVKTVKKVQSSIQKFESLSLGDGLNKSGDQTTNSRSKTLRSNKPIIDISTAAKEEQILEISKSQETVKSTAANKSSASVVKKHRHHDSSVFHQQTYLKEPARPSLSDNAREILRCQPCHDDLVAVLQYLQFGIEGRHDFNVHVTSSKAAQIINVLVTVTIPDVWTNMKQTELSEDEAKIKKAIISSLTSVAGIGGLLGQIKQLAAAGSNTNMLGDTIMVLGEVMKGHRMVARLLQDSQKLYDKESNRRLHWQEVVALLGGSKVLSTVAQAFAADSSLSSDLRPYLWLGNGIEYTRWLSQNVTHFAMQVAVPAEESWRCLGLLIKRGMSLGYRDVFVTGIYTELLLGQRALWTAMHFILKYLPSSDQKAFFDSVLSSMAQKYLESAGGPAVAYSHDPGMQKIVAGAAALIAGIVKNNKVLEDHMEHWLKSGNGTSAAVGLSSKRALVAAFGRSEEKLQRTLEKSLGNFGDKLQIQHASILQQEATAQTILLLIGHLNRIDVNILKSSSISTLVMHAVSNRLSASVPRARLLGMIVATAISKLVDKPENVIDFDIDEMKSEDANNWLKLVSLDDYVGQVLDIFSSSTPLLQLSITQHKPATKHAKRIKPTQTSKIIAIEEVNDSADSDDDDDLTPYLKPDSDPEDSDEDPTLINRSKPSAPVYIVDLIKQLQDTDKPDVVALALKNATSLIRRKTSFGAELSDNVQTLVTVLINLQDGMTDLDLRQLRLQSLVACIVARTDVVSLSLADVYFRGDFSLSQRLVILIAIGLAARELAGFKDDHAVESADVFPSKRLPAHLEPQVQQQTIATKNPIAMLTDIAAHSTIRPMALAAADKVTGPSALKIRTFSSRMDVEKKQLEKAAARTKIIPKNLHKLLVESMYLPLCSRMGLLLSSAMSGRLPNTTVLHSSTVRLFLQTLTLLLHTLGPSAGLHLPSLSHETLLLLLDLRGFSHLSTDPAILPALLHLLLALLDITIEAGTTAQERLITDYGVQVTELVSWSNSLGDKISVSDAESDGDGIPWSVLAAGIQVKWFEIGNRFQSRMLGLTMDEMNHLSGT